MRLQLKHVDSLQSFVGKYMHVLWCPHMGCSGITGEILLVWYMHIVHQTLTRGGAKSIKVI
jgi:hypothetical protein